MRECPPSGLCVWTLGLQLVALFWEAAEPLYGVGHSWLRCVIHNWPFRVTASLLQMELPVCHHHVTDHRQAQLTQPPAAVPASQPVLATMMSLPQWTVSSGTVSQKKSLDSLLGSNRRITTVAWMRNVLHRHLSTRSSVGGTIVCVCVKRELGNVALLNCWRTMTSEECFESEEPHQLPGCPLCSMLMVADVNCQFPVPGAMLTSGSQASQSQPTLIHTEPET